MIHDILDTERKYADQDSGLHKQNDEWMNENDNT
jgi:hypothetical protein